MWNKLEHSYFGEPVTSVYAVLAGIFRATSFELLAVGTLGNKETYGN